MALGGGRPRWGPDMMGEEGATVKGKTWKEGGEKRRREETGKLRITARA